MKYAHADGDDDDDRQEPYAIHSEAHWAFNQPYREGEATTMGRSIDVAVPRLFPIPRLICNSD